MPELGERLREVRRSRGYELIQLEAALKVKTKYLRALEWERFDLLPDEKTARRILRAYAASLELDESAFVHEFDMRVGAKPAATPAAESRPTPRPKPMHVRGAFLLGLIPALPAAIAIPVILIHDHSGSRHANPAPPVRARASSLTSGATPGVAKRRSHQPAQKRMKAAPARSSTAAVAPAPRRARLEVAASRGDSWVMVRADSARGALLYSGILAQGQRIHFRKARLWLRLGAAANVDVTVNGGRPRSGLSGTFDAVVTPRGFRKVPLASGGGP
jgi:cytoskeletal protein RodZ